MCRFLHHLAILPDNHRKFHGAVLGRNILGRPAQGALGAQRKGRRFGGLADMSVHFHRPINCRTDSIAVTPEMVSRFAGRLRLSQTAQRAASGR